MDELWEVHTPANTEQTKGWTSIHEALQCMKEVSRMKPLHDELYVISTRTSLNKEEPQAHSSSSSTTNDFPSHLEGECYNSDEDVPMSMGRGDLIKNLQQRYSRAELDRKLYADLREIIGPGYSNELIERNWGFADTSSNTVGQFEDAQPSSKVTESPSYKKETETVKKSEVYEVEEPSFGIVENPTPEESVVIPKLKKGRQRRCRNALVLRLTGQDGHDPPALIRGLDDVQIQNSNKTSYSAAVNSKNPNTVNLDGSSSSNMFSEEDFPSL